MGTTIENSHLADVASLFSATKVFLVLFGIVILGMAASAIASLGERLHHRFPSRRLFIAQTVTVISFIIYIGGGTYLIYGVIRPPQSLLLTVSGTLAVALGLSLKDLVASVVAGVILIFDRPFQVGDRITFNGMYGEVKTIGLRAVRIVTLDDSIITIPNNRFISEAVASGNSGALDMMVEINFNISLNADMQLANKLLFETAVTSKYAFLKKPVSIVMNEVDFAGRPAAQLRVKCYVLDVRFEKALQTDIILRGNQTLLQKGIPRPIFEIQNAAL